MRQVRNRRKKAILMLTLSKTVKGHSNVEHVANKLWNSRHEWSKLKKMKPIAVSGAFETTVQSDRQSQSLYLLSVTGFASTPNLAYFTPKLFR